MAQRISRAKQQIRAAGARFTPPDAADRDQRVRAVQQVLYLVFNEGYTASAGQRLQRTDLTAEGLRLARLLRGLLPGDAETAGLLALMLLTDARRAARATPGGALVPLTEQDRRRWDRRLIAEGTALVEQTLATSRALGPYQMQAAIAAVHDEAASVADTDWAEVLSLYELLAKVSPGPMVSLARRSRSRWCTARQPGYPQPMTWPGCSAGTTGTTPSAATCTRWPGTVRRPPRITGPRPDMRQIFPNDVTWNAGWLAS